MSLFAPKTPTEKTEAVQRVIAELVEVSKGRPSILLTVGKPQRTHDTIVKIIESARTIFTLEGHAGLSLRQVADDASIAVGNLSYHFPTKRALLDAMMREKLAEYIDEHLQQFEADKDAPLDILLNVVEFYVRNARTSHRFFFQMWGYAGCDAEAMEAVRNLYQPIGRFIYSLIRAANTELNDDEIRRATLQIFSLEEGYKMFIGMGPDNDGALKTAEHDIRVLTKRIVCCDKQ